MQIPDMSGHNFLYFFNLWELGVLGVLHPAVGFLAINTSASHCFGKLQKI